MGNIKARAQQCPIIFRLEDRVFWNQAGDLAAHHTTGFEDVALEKYFAPWTTFLYYLTRRKIKKAQKCARAISEPGTRLVSHTDLLIWRRESSA
jgi:hypothetical protein